MWCPPNGESLSLTNPSDLVSDFTKQKNKTPQGTGVFLVFLENLIS